MRRFRFDQLSSAIDLSYPWFALLAVVECAAVRHGRDRDHSVKPKNSRSAAVYKLAEAVNFSLFS
jgi:hypothetical protein